MAKKSTKGREHGATRAKEIPAMYFHPTDRSVEPDPERGSVTEGEGIIATFSALKAEGIFAQYVILGAAIGGMGQTDLTAERYGASYGERVGIEELNWLRGNHRGHTLHRACRERRWVAIMPRLCTDEEIRTGCKDCGSRMDAQPETLVMETHRWYRAHHSQSEGTQEEVRKWRTVQYGLPDLPDMELVAYYGDKPLPDWYRRGITYDDHEVSGPDDDRYPSSTIRAAFHDTVRVGTEESYTAWAKEFAAEVEVCAGRFNKDPELPHELDRLIENLRSYEVCNTPAAVPLLDGSSANGRGAHIRRMMGDGKERLLRQLGRIAAEHASVGGTTAATPLDRLKWKSSTAAFAHIFRTLAAQGYFDLPRKGGKEGDANTTAFARTLLQAFEIPKKDGTPVTPEMLRVRLVDGAPGQLTDTKAAKFQIPAAGELIVPNAGELE